MDGKLVGLKWGVVESAWEVRVVISHLLLGRLLLGLLLPSFGMLTRSLEAGRMSLHLCRRWVCCWLYTFCWLLRWLILGWFQGKRLLISSQINPTLMKKRPKSPKKKPFRSTMQKWNNTRFPFSSAKRASPTNHPARFTVPSAMRVLKCTTTIALGSEIALANETTNTSCYLGLSLCCMPYWRWQLMFGISTETRKWSNRTQRSSS